MLSFERVGLDFFKIYMNGNSTDYKLYYDVENDEFEIRDNTVSESETYVFVTSLSKLKEEYGTQNQDVQGKIDMIMLDCLYSYRYAHGDQP